MVYNKKTLEPSVPARDGEGRQVDDEPLPRTGRRAAATPQSTLGAALDRIEDPLFVIDARRQLEFANRAAKQLVERGAHLCIQRGRLSFTAEEYRVRFDRLLRQLGAPSDAPREPIGLRLPRRNASRDWLLLISPLQGDLPLESRLLLHLVSRARPRRISRPLMRDLFALNWRELALIEGLIRGESLRAIAAQTSMTLETVRTYLKRIFVKCEVRSQVELLALVQRLALLDSG